MTSAITRAGSNEEFIREFASPQDVQISMTLSDFVGYWHFQALQFVRVRAFKALARRFVINHPQKNGELWLVQSLYEAGSSDDPFTVVDVGGNRGEWGRLVSQIASNVRVHSCEPVPAFYEQLVASKTERQVAHNVALASTAGRQKIYVTAHDAGGSAARQRPGKDNYEVEVASITGDDLVDRIDAPTIHFIKIDIDGREFEILESFKQTIDAQRPVVQFEFGDFSYYCGHSFFQFWDFAAKSGYSLYRLHAGRLHKIKKYRPYHELAINLNYVLMPNERRL